MGFLKQIKVHKLQMKCSNCRVYWDSDTPYCVSRKTVTNFTLLLSTFKSFL